jgi:hypothetical protein
VFCILDVPICVFISALMAVFKFASLPVRFEFIYTQVNNILDDIHTVYGPSVIVPRWVRLGNVSNVCETFDKLFERRGEHFSFIICGSERIMLLCPCT